MDSVLQRSAPAPDLPPKNPPRAFVARWAYPIFFLGLMAAAASPLFVRLSDIGPVATGALRMTLALPLFLIFLLVQARSAPIAPGSLRRDFPLLLACGLFFACDLGMWNWSVALTSIANATLLANLTPVFVVIASWVLFRERAGKMFLIGLGVGLAGSALMMSESLQLSPRNFLGDVLGMVTAGLYASYMMVVVRLRQRTSTAVIMVATSAVAAAVLWIAAGFTETAFWPHSTQGWVAMAGMVLLTQICGQAFIAVSLAHVPANFSAMSFLIQPVLPAIAAWFMFGEGISWRQLLGACAVLAGLAISRLGAPATPG